MRHTQRRRAATIALLSCAVSAINAAQNEPYRDAIRLLSPCDTVATLSPDETAQIAICPDFIESDDTSRCAKNPDFIERSAETPAARNPDFIEKSAETPAAENADFIERITAARGRLFAAFVEGECCDTLRVYEASLCAYPAASASPRPVATLTISGDDGDGGGVKPLCEWVASQRDNVVALRLRAADEGAVGCRLRLASALPSRTSLSPSGQFTVTGHASGDAMQAVHFYVIARIVADEGLDGAGKSSIRTDADAVVVTDAATVTIYIVCRTSYNGPHRHPVEEGAPYVEDALDDAWHTVNVTFEQVRRHAQADEAAP